MRSSEREEWIQNEDLRPCDCCGCALGPCFYVVDEALAVVDPERANMHLGLTQMWGHRPGSEALANTMGPGAVFKVSEESRTRRFICQACTR